MRVAIIVPRIDQLGPVKVTQNLVNFLIRFDGIIPEVFYLDKTVDHNVRIAVKAERLVPRNFRFSDYDIIHTNGIRPDLFAFINRKKIRHHISTIHNFVFDDLAFNYNRLISWFFGHIWLILWKRADKLVCLSDNMKYYYSKWFPLSKLEVIYNGIAEAEEDIPDNDVITTINRLHLQGFKVAGNVSVLTRIKGVDQILNFLSEEKELALAVIGSGKELSSLQKQAEKMKIADRCIFFGFRGNAVKYFRFFDFLIISSISEGFGLVLIEAVQQKVPVICSDIPVFNELFNNEEVTFFKLNDLKSLAEALKSVMENGNKKTDLAYARYLNNYTALSMARSYYELYKSEQQTHIN
jgi:L-malate glycosyltransferase